MTRVVWSVLLLSLLIVRMVQSEIIFHPTQKSTRDYSLYVDRLSPPKTDDATHSLTGQGSFRRPTISSRARRRTRRCQTSARGRRLVDDKLIFVIQNNILISADGHPLLCDFGLLSILIDCEFTTISQGAYRYQAPELRPGTGPNKATDVYAFALSSYEV